MDVIDKLQTVYLEDCVCCVHMSLLSEDTKEQVAIYQKKKISPE